MATNLPVYITSNDIRDTYPAINRFDLKYPIYGVIGNAPNFTVYDSGLVENLFINGRKCSVDLTPDSDYEYYYNSGLDTLTFYLSDVVGSQLNIESGSDVATKLQDIAYKSSRMFDSLVDRKMPTNMWLNGDGVYDYVIKRCCSLIAVHLFITAHDPNNEDAEKIKEEYEEIIEKINDGRIKLSFEKSADSSQGIIQHIKVDSSTGLYPLDLRGRYLDDYDRIRLQVTGTGTIGIATYSVWRKSNNTLGINKGQQVIENAIITGGYDKVCDGLEVRFGSTTPLTDDGSTTLIMDYVATQNDLYQIECHGVGAELDDSRGITSTKITRSL